MVNKFKIYSIPFIAVVAIVFTILLISNKAFTLITIFQASFSPQIMLIIYLSVTCFFIYKREKGAAFLFGALTIIAFNVSVDSTLRIIGQNYQGLSVDDILECIFLPLDMGVYFVLILAYYTKGNNYKITVRMSALIMFIAFGVFVRYYLNQNDPPSWVVTIVVLIIPFIVMIISRMRSKYL